MAFISLFATLPTEVVQLMVTLKFTLNQNGYSFLSRIPRPVGGFYLLKGRFSFSLSPNVEGQLIVAVLSVLL